MRKIQGIDFGPIWWGSGATGFDGKGWWYDKVYFVLSLFGLLGYTTRGVTDVFKTTTATPLMGNMPMKADGLRPKELFPKCVEVHFREGAAMNVVGLSNKGTEFYLRKGIWEDNGRARFISFMPVGQTPDARLDEVHRFGILVYEYRSRLGYKVGIQLNVSCQNTAHSTTVSETVEEVRNWLQVLSRLSIPVVVKLNALFPIEAAKEISFMAGCAGIHVSNTFLHGDAASSIDWKKFPSLKRRGMPKDGSLSGAPLFPFVHIWVAKAREAGITTHINAGGGILTSGHVRQLFEAGADSVSIATVKIVRPWRLRAIIRTAHACYGRRS